MKNFTRKYWIVLIFIIIAVVSGCKIDLDNKVTNLPNDSLSRDLSEWQNISQGIKLKEDKIFENNSLIDTVLVLKINPGFFDFSIQQDSNFPKTILEWQKETMAEIIINGGYFNEEFKPTGLLIVNGEKFGTPSLDGSNGYTGMFLVKNGQPEIRYLPQTNFSLLEDVSFGLQCFPTLILPGGKSGEVLKTDKKARRTIIAQDKEGNILLVLTKGNYFTLYEMMNYLLKSNLNIDAALNLDGGPSTGISININDFNYNIESLPVPNVMVIKSKNNS